MNKLSTFLFLTMLNIPSVVTAGVINFGSAENYIFATASTEQLSGNLILGSEAHVFGSVAASNRSNSSVAVMFVIVCFFSRYSPFSIQ